MGTLQITHQKFPIPVGILMDCNLLQAKAFERQADKDLVPSWRDGEAGNRLQLHMVTVLDRRYFEFELYKVSDAKPFATAANWVHYAGLSPYIEEIFKALKQEFPTADLVQSRHREIWKAEYDGQIVSLSTSLPSLLENNPLTMQSRIREQLDAIRTLVSALSALPTTVVNVGKDASADAQGSGDAKAKDVVCGNISMHITGYDKLSKGEKLDLAGKMTTSAADEANAEVRKACCKQAYFCFPLLVTS